MLFDIFFPESLSLSDYEHCLQRGWYRDAGMMLQTQMTFLNHQACTVVPLRANLKEFQFTKSQRKNLKKNDRRFKTVIRPASFDIERERLYQAFKPRFYDYVKDTLKEVFQTIPGQQPYLTYELDVLDTYDNDKLIAVSYFDLARQSVYSLLALYDMDYKEYSLGTYTMMKEIEYSIAIQKQYYMPGFIVDIPSFLDYKLKINQLEFFTWKSKGWSSIEDLAQEKTCSRVILDKLNSFKEDILNQYQLKGKVIHNKEYFVYVFDRFTHKQTKTITSPIYLDLKGNNGHSIVVEYNYDEDFFLITRPFYKEVIFKGSDYSTAINKAYQAFITRNYFI